MLRSLAFLCFAAVPALAQTVLQPLRASELVPSVGGKWAGPFWPPIAASGELTHALYVPPNDAGGSPVGQVFFVANQYRNCNVTFDPNAHSLVWAWDPANPNAIASLQHVPNTQREELWCSGHAIAPNGDLWSFGGTDLTQPCYFGSSGVFRWSPASAWQAVGSLDPLAPRWYPCAIEMGTPTGSQFLVLGHEQRPIGPEETHQILDLASGTASPLFFNIVADAACQPGAARARFMGYPWTHWLAAGAPFVSGPLETEKYYGCAAPNGSFRWQRAPSAARMREAGNSLHFLDWLPSGREESIYLIGGLSSFLGPGAKSGAADWYVLDSMESIRAPAPNSSANWQNEPSLRFNRRHAVSVQTPDGDFIVVGGIGWTGPSNPGGSMVARTTPEHYDRAHARWTSLNPQAVPRSYHSLALLLRDGRILSAGGVLDPGHSVEIFSPPYLFRGPRPTVVTAPSALGYCNGAPCGSFTLTVDLGAADDPVQKVSLLRPASVTHGFDQNQRFVELPIQASSQPDPVNLPLRWDLQVALPDDWNVAPPGWYLLFAVSRLGIPAIGEYVRIR
ncbi:MAG: DUF1929 domain-containing protein [Planctomycetes bacterium]|nr:DUF1929 domain-containing protein [Planctomycetota bacterium]